MPTDPTFTYACRSTAASGQETSTERSRDVHEVSHSVYLTIDCDVREDDLIRVVDADGNEIFPLGQIVAKKTVYNGVGPHHLELRVAVQRGPV